MTATYYARKIAQNAVTVDNSRVAELIADAAEDADAELTWSDQGELHEEIEIAIEEEARHIAETALRDVLEES